MVLQKLMNLFTSKQEKKMTKKEVLQSVIQRERAIAPVIVGNRRDLSNKTDLVRKLAYSLWEKAGCPIGDGVNFWLEAEKTLS